MEDYAPPRYKIMEKIGEGVHGYVFKAFDLQRNREVAIKKVALKNKFGNISLNTLREIKTLQLCNSEYIVNIVDIYPDLSGLSLVLEYMPDTLYGKLKNEADPLSRQQVRKFTFMMLKGIQYLHDMGIMHRDIKPANLLISNSGVLKIADFGLARLYFPEQTDKLYSPQVSTRWYRAPEILWGSQKYGPPVDMWAAGCVIAEMLRGIPIFMGTTDIEQLALVIRTLGTPRLNEWPDLPSLPDYNKIRFPNAVGVHWDNLFPSCTHAIEINLVSNLIVYNPSSRLKATELLTCTCEIIRPSDMESFSCQPGFCPLCGTILPPPQTKGNVKCYNCKNEFQPDVFGEQEIEYTLHFNNYDPTRLGKDNAETKAEPDGPIVERKCPKCGHDKMSYATLQLRSADEGQTVFFTCLKCKFKESENS